MWLKTVDGSYYNMVTGTQLSVREANVGGEFRVYVMNAGGHTPVACLQDGYRSAEDAEEALDNVLSTQDVVALDVPDYSDEDTDTTDDSDEDIVYEDNYETVPDEELRSELASRELSTRGNNKQLVARLRKDDAKREPETV